MACGALSLTIPLWSHLSSKFDSKRERAFKHQPTTLGIACSNSSPDLPATTGNCFLFHFFFYFLELCRMKPSWMRVMNWLQTESLFLCVQNLNLEVELSPRWV